MKQLRTTTKRHVLKPADMQAVLEEMLPVGEGKPPLKVVGWTRRGVWTRLQADYPNGVVLTAHFDRNGAVSSCKASLSTTIRFGGDRAPQGTIADSDRDDGA